MDCGLMDHGSVGFDLWNRLLMESTVEKAYTSLAYLTLHSIDVLCDSLCLIPLELDTVSCRI